ncbi:conserved hypothetical protein [Ricinus communis]|uniref:Uncharacterized protein n=1 Tax=Ricinus communis TaxID=3988 RepID=B9RSI0_RICCO|nr:conserved hypothetical protein [Ricinus communis]
MKEEGLIEYPDWCKTNKGEGGGKIVRTATQVIGSSLFGQSQHLGTQFGYKDNLDNSSEKGTRSKNSTSYEKFEQILNE